MIERDVDCMKYRTHTHLASVDVEVIIAEKGKCVLTIKDAYYSKSEVKDGKKVGTNLNGKVTDGYYIEFNEPLVSPMCVNSGNRDKISKQCKTVKNLDNLESRKVSNWIGLTVELFVDERVKFGSEIKSGIRVKDYTPPIPISISDVKKKLNDSKTKIELATNWQLLSREEQKLTGIFELKEELKTKLQ